MTSVCCRMPVESTGPLTLLSEDSLGVRRWGVVL